MKKKLAFALDISDIKQAQKIVDEISGLDIIIKVGYVLFIKGGISFIKEIKNKNFEVFLDLKFHDIPNTVYNGVSAVRDLEVDYLTLHTLGGPDMIKRAIKAKENSNLKLLGVTLLTSHNRDYIDYIGSKYTIEDLALKLAKTGIELGLDGIVCSAEEVKKIKNEIKKPFLAVVPGIRPEGGESDDQTRVSTPKTAIQSGADILVIGRPILKAKNKRAFIENLLKEIS